MKYPGLHIIIMLLVPIMGYSQESVFSLLKSDLRKADELYEKSAYYDAIELYKTQLNKNKEVGIKLKIASSYFQLNRMQEAVVWYQEGVNQQADLKDRATFEYASALHATGDYENAIKWYEKYQQKHPENLEITTKIWQLKNIHYLFEDSIYYTITRLPVNTNFDEYGPAIYQNTLVFTTNRPKVSIVQRQDATLQMPFFHWQKSNYNLDSAGNLQFTDTQVFAADIHAKYHKGTVNFNEQNKLMVFSRTENKTHGGIMTSKLFFAQKSENGQWEEIGDFPFSSNDYSVMHPHFVNGANTLYFTSDMPGGLGGTDLYVSEFLQGNWTKPKNLGPEINTSGNEGHPHLYQDILYFSSNGHPGLGGIDIFRVNLTDQQTEVINPGYPVNTHFDDFAVVLETSGTNGFLVSNRSDEEPINDNLYHIKMAVNAFPLAVEGNVRFKRSEALIAPEDEFVLLGNARLELIDTNRQEVVEEVYTDDSGHFKLQIPVQSQYVLRVSQKDIGTAIVSMEIPKNYKDFLEHDIVIVEDLFK